MGDSHGYSCEQTAVGTTNGAGGRNVQLFMISPDGVVLHALAGFWHPEDLLRELTFARQRLLPLWQDPSLAPHVKRAMCAALQQEEAASHGEMTRLRSSWQGFDAKNELKRFEKLGERDTVMVDASGEPVRCRKGKVKLKTLDVLVHDRMTTRPFVPFEQFDVMAFADYGREYYDNNKKVDGAGETFMTPKRVAKVEAKADKKRRKALKRAQRRLKSLAKQRERRAKRRMQARGKARQRETAKRKDAPKPTEDAGLVRDWF